jgi:hypothetical protein
MHAGIEAARLADEQRGEDMDRYMDRGAEVLKLAEVSGLDQDIVGGLLALGLRSFADVHNADEALIRSINGVGKATYTKIRQAVIAAMIEAGELPGAEEKSDQDPDPDKKSDTPNEADGETDAEKSAE